MERMHFLSTVESTLPVLLKPAIPDQKRRGKKEGTRTPTVRVMSYTQKNEYSQKKIIPYHLISYHEACGGRDSEERIALQRLGKQ